MIHDLPVTRTVYSWDEDLLDDKIQEAIDATWKDAIKQGYHSLAPTLHFTSTLDSEGDMQHTVIIQFHYRRQEG